MSQRESVGLRKLLWDVLRLSDRPLSAVEVAQRPEVVAAGVDTSLVSTCLSQMYRRKKYNIGRLPSVQAHTQWEYFIRRAAEPRVNAVYSEPAEEPAPQDNDFQFDPIELGEAVVTPAEGAKAITLTVAGVTIRIELSH